uniref:Uncharacterized protein n=1 Tax=Tanacetum cinerariifolium TaxID=118510 RepID=A0A6L2J5V8_TANCI|nr:hypothetical protein [Tanacetum cinerariifolium]
MSQAAWNAEREVLIREAQDSKTLAKEARKEAKEARNEAKETLLPNFRRTSTSKQDPRSSNSNSFFLVRSSWEGRLTGPNYMDWMRNLRFTLRYENKEYVLDEKIPTINDDSTHEEIEAHQKHYDDANKVACIMASFMSPELQKTFENTWAYEMNQQLKEMFQTKARKERLDAVKSLMGLQTKTWSLYLCFRLKDERVL